ncbi:helix-turn-helix transcriptional regulator [Microbaculum marinum]|uniref:Helix-turn-helix transcriptional regulator n=1 Tax=Microbaculum marinum TaxID=1764581 RepID=A0AAW9RUY6_9HYPH
MSGEASLETFSGLVGSIYDCTFDPGRWDETLAGIAVAFGGEVVNLSLNDRSADRLLIEKSVGWGAPWLAERQKHLPEIHARLSEWLARGPSPDEPYVASQQLDAAYLEASAYVRDCLKPRGIADIMHYVLMETPAYFSELVVGLSVNRGLITDREIRIGKLLLPHLRRAVTISNLLDVRALERARFAETLDALRCAVILVDERAMVLYANRRAQEMLRSGSAIRTVGGALRAGTIEAARELGVAIRIAATDETEIGASGLAVPLADPAASPLFAHVLPIRGSAFRADLDPSAVAVVFIGAPPGERDGAEAMAAAFRLTPAETRVLAGLFAGRTLSEAARVLGIAPSTAKTHLDNIFQKTGTSRQVDLMRLVTQLVPVARRPEP